MLWFLVAPTIFFSSLSFGFQHGSRSWTKRRLNPPIRYILATSSVITDESAGSRVNFIPSSKSVPLLEETSHADELIEDTSNEEMIAIGNLFSKSPFSTRAQRRKEYKELALKRRVVTAQEEVMRDRQDQLFLLLGVVPSIFAFLSWEEVSHSLAIFIDRYGTVGRAVDGGQFTSDLLRPTITGVVVPVISIALATLVSTTINVLRARQVELRALVNKESCEIRLLRRAVFGMFGTRQHASRRAKALALLCGYVEQVDRECSVGAVEALEELQLRGGISVNELDLMAEMLHSVDGAAASRQNSVDVAEGLIMSLNGHRSDRVALVLSVFPVVHWGLLIGLSFSVCLAFLLNSNQQVLLYLNSLQLRTLFAILVGVFSGTATLCLNLADPFRGSFSIAEASTQLTDLRLCLKRDVAEACTEEGEISSRIVHALLLGRSGNTNVDRSGLIADDDRLPRSNEGRKPKGDSRGRGDDSGSRRYGLASTIYFHLLTGPLGSNARVLGDVVAWISSFVARGKRSLALRCARVFSVFGRK